MGVIVVAKGEILAGLALPNGLIVDACQCSYGRAVLGLKQTSRASCPGVPSRLVLFQSYPTIFRRSP